MSTVANLRVLFVVCGLLAAAPVLAGETKPPSSAGACGSSNDRYDPSFAQWLSVSSTLGGSALSAVFLLAGSFTHGNPVALFTVGGVIGAAALTVGPPLGHLYVKNYAWPLGRMGFRLALAGLGSLAAMRWLSSEICSDDCEAGGEWGLPVMIISSAAFAFLMVWDIVTVKREARRANERDRSKRLSASIAPALYDARGRAAGLQLALSF